MDPTIPEMGNIGLYKWVWNPILEDFHAAMTGLGMIAIN